MKEKLERAFRLSRAEWIVLFAAFCLCFFLLGYTVGRDRGVEAIIVETERTPEPAAAVTESAPEQVTPPEEDPSGPVNINTAAAEELSSLDGIGEVLAERIVRYREEHGPFKTVYELVDVSGIGDAKLNAILDDITVG